MTSRAAGSSPYTPPRSRHVETRCESTRRRTVDRIGLREAPKRVGYFGDPNSPDSVAAFTDSDGESYVAVADQNTGVRTFSARGSGARRKRVRLPTARGAR